MVRGRVCKSVNEHERLYDAQRVDAETVHTASERSRFSRYIDVHPQVSDLENAKVPKTSKTH